jgi:hypothetical protein
LSPRRLTPVRDGRGAADDATDTPLVVPSPREFARKEAGMPKSWSDKRERQYEHIKDSYEDRGRSEDKAEELAARTVNKTRREHGETKSKG